MPQKKNNLISSITIPLLYEPWQADILNRRMELCRIVYNTIIDKKRAALSLIEEDKKYIEAVGELNRVYSITDEKERNIAFKSAGFKEARQVSSSMLKDAGISEYAFIGDSVEEAKRFKENITSSMAIYSIAKPAWRAFDSYLYGSGTSIKNKQKGSLNSIATDGKSGIRLTDPEGSTILRNFRGGVASTSFAAHLSKSA